MVEYTRFRDDGWCGDVKQDRTKRQLRRTQYELGNRRGNQHPEGVVHIAFHSLFSHQSRMGDAGAVYQIGIFPGSTGRGMYSILHVGFTAC